MPQTTPSHDLRGREVAAQERLDRILNPAELSLLRLQGGERILELGSGPGLFARDMARAAGGHHPVVSLERDEAQIYRCLELATACGEEALLDVRQSELSEFELAAGEWGSFDLVHCRGVLAEVAEPQALVERMARALAPAGRLVLAADDHDSLRLWPAMPAVDELWRARIRALTDEGRDPYLGRKLVAMLSLAELRPVRSEQLLLGGCAGASSWYLVAGNLLDLLESARPQILATSAIGADVFDDVIDGLGAWIQRADSALWYPSCWAEAVRDA